MVSTFLHPFALAIALANIRILQDEKMVENAATQGQVMKEEMSRLSAAHPSIKETRNIGLFGKIDLQDEHGNLLAMDHPAMVALKEHFDLNGIFTYFKAGGFMCNPPLSITTDQLKDVFKIIDKGLAEVDSILQS